MLHTNQFYDHVIDERDVFGKYVLELGQVIQPVKFGTKASAKHMLQTRNGTDLSEP